MRIVSETDKFRIIAKENKGEDCYFLEIKSGEKWLNDRGFGILDTDEDAILSGLDHIKNFHREHYLDQLMKLDPDDVHNFPEEVEVKERFVDIDDREVKFFAVHHERVKIGECWFKDDEVSAWYFTYKPADGLKETYEEYRSKLAGSRVPVFPKLDQCVHGLFQEHKDFSAYALSRPKKRGFFARIFGR